MSAPAVALKLATGARPTVKDKIKTLSVPEEILEPTVILLLNETAGLQPC